MLIRRVLASTFSICALLTSDARAAAPGRPPVPPAILEKAALLVREQVGPDIFDQRTTFDAAGSYAEGAVERCVNGRAPCAEFLKRPHFYVRFAFRVPDLEVTRGIGLVLDETGAPVPERPLYGAPNCGQFPEMCRFPVTEAAAVTIATKAGLETGLAPWKMSFHWSAGRHQRYVWTITNTLMREERHESGATMVIDAHDGRVLERVTWWKELD